MSQSDEQTDIWLDSHMKSAIWYTQWPYNENVITMLRKIIQHRLWIPRWQITRASWLISSWIITCLQGGQVWPALTCSTGLIGEKLNIYTVTSHNALCQGYTMWNQHGNVTVYKYSVSNVILADEKLTLFHQYLWYRQKWGTIVFTILGAILWV